MSRVAVLAPDGVTVSGVYMGAVADMPGSIPVPDGLPVGPGTAWDPVSEVFLVEAPPPPAAKPRSLSRMEFVNLAQSAGGMTDAQLVAAHADPNLAAMWLKMQLAEAVDRDDPGTQAGLGGMAQLGYLPNGAAAVIAAWPIV